MAARTFTSAGTNNLWSNPANWDGGTTIPQEDDSVTIPSGQTCEYDYNSAYTTGIAGITITGTLSLTRTAGTYKLFMKAATTIGGTGTFDCGTSASPIPFTAKHTITGGAAWYIKGNDSTGLTMTVYGAEPVNKIIRLSGDEAIGQTALSVDADVTGDIWAVGDIIRIDDINKGLESEERTIANISANEVTITAGLTAAKSTGAIVSLITRNVKFVGVGTSGYMAQNFASGKLTVGGGQWTTANYRTFNACTNMAISGGTFSGNTYGLGSCTGASISGGTFSGNSYGLGSCTATIKGVTFVSNGYDINTCVFDGYNISLTSATPNLNYSSLSKEIYSYIVNYGEVGGAYKAWTKGGVTTSQTTNNPTGFTSNMSTALENATNEGYWQKEVLVGAGASVTISMALRKSASMTYLPRIIIFDKASTDPFAGGTGLNTFTMTNSVDTWEYSTYVYTNTGTADVTLVIRSQGMNATGTMLSAVKVDVINVDLTSALAKLDAIKAKTDILKNPTLLIDNEIIV